MAERRFELRAGGHRLEAAWIGPPPEEKTTLVLLHEGLGCTDAWKDFPARLAGWTGLGVLVYSRWGYGRSDPVTLPRPLRYMHDEGAVLPEVLRAAGVRDAVLVGHSDGASIAIVAAGSAPAREDVPIRALALLAPHVFCEDRSVEGIEKARDAYAHGELRARLAKYHADVDGAFWGWNRAWLDPDFRRWNIEEYLPAIEVPVLVVQGDADEYGTLAQVDAIERAVRGPVTRCILHGAGHSPQRDAADATLAAIANLVSSSLPR
ncbi:MAG TPA: alpha/beta hydrolase [Polyangiaceae bacterium]|nr:alpha/beta hydrolase [Polyangiaceae bacterium]